MNPKLGCRLPVNKPALVLSDFFVALPPTPAVDYLAGIAGWPWWMNNVAGTCVAATWAAAKRLVSIRLAGHDFILSDAEILALYRTQNPGFDPAHPGVHDNGMDVQTLLELLQKRGEIVAFGKIDPAKHDAAISILGFEVTAIVVRYANMDDYNAGRNWDYHPDSAVYGQHAILSGGHVDQSGNDVRFETWRKVQGFTQAFWAHDVATWGVILPEHLGSKRFLDGMDLPALAAAFLAFTGRVLPIPPPVNPPTPPRSAVNITAIPPVRLLDTRSGNGLSGKFTAHVPRSVQIAGRGGIPTNATIVAGNLTVAAADKKGNVAVGPDPIASPATSTLNFKAGDELANGFISALRADGTLALVLGDGSTADLIVDITAFFTP